MTPALLYGLGGVLLFVLGLSGMIRLGEPLRKILAFNLMGSGTFLALVGLAQRDGVADPVPQAMVLTGIVVSVAATALALALGRRLHELAAPVRPQEEMIKEDGVDEKGGHG